MRTSSTLGPCAVYHIRSKRILNSNRVKSRLPILISQLPSHLDFLLSTAVLVKSRNVWATTTNVLEERGFARCGYAHRTYISHFTGALGLIFAYRLARLNPSLHTMFTPNSYESTNSVIRWFIHDVNESRSVKLSTVLADAWIPRFIWSLFIVKRKKYAHRLRLSCFDVV